MILQPFNHSIARWDDFKAFHIRHHYERIVQFDTQEVIILGGYFYSRHRGEIRGLGMTIFDPRDGLPERGTKLVTPAGEHVPLSWLPNQNFLYDHSTSWVVPLGYSFPYAPFPERFRGLCSCYIPGPGRTPVAKPVMLNALMKLSKGEKADLKAKVLNLRAMHRIMIGDTWKHYYHRPLKGEELLYTPLEDVNSEMRARVALRGIRAPRERREEPYLKLVSL